MIPPFRNASPNHHPIRTKTKMTKKSSASKSPATRRHPKRKSLHKFTAIVRRQRAARRIDAALRTLRPESAADLPENEFILDSDFRYASSSGFGSGLWVDEE